jgi:hypothetical protein
MLLDFEKDQNGFKPFRATRENLKANIGKMICYVDFVDKYRGTYFVRYGRVELVRYSNLFLEGGRIVDIRDIKEAGIKIEPENPA